MAKYTVSDADRATAALEDSDVALARRVAQGAGELLIAVRRSGLFEGEALGRAGDRVANAFIMQALANARPDDAVLCEEEADGPERLGASRVWIVDPLDGTREYGEGRGDWAVHVALATDGHATVGAVALPDIGETLCSSPGPTPVAPSGKLRMLVSRSRPAAEAVAVAERMGADLVAMGSAGAKAMAVVRGDAEIYLHTGGQYEWDNARPPRTRPAPGCTCRGSTARR